MTKPSRALMQVVDFLGELGPRWGLPADACRVHGYLFVLAKPVSEAALRDALGLNAKATGEALAWLTDYGIAEQTRDGAGDDSWRTDSDPWELMVRALKERQRREVGPALELLRESKRTALAEGSQQRVIAAQIEKLLRLAEDLAAINTQAQRLSPNTLRRMIGLGGMAARVIDRTFGGREEVSRERSANARPRSERPKR